MYAIQCDAMCCYEYRRFGMALRPVIILEAFVLQDTNQLGSFIYTDIICLKSWQGVQIYHPPPEDLC